jgi:hypothetical protein
MATFFNITERAKEIEDEQHFIFQCNGYSDFRNSTQQNIPAGKMFPELANRK